MGVVIGAVAVVFVLALIIFPGVRGKLKVLVGGFLNIFVEDIAKTPEGAKAVFQQAIEEVQERYNKAGDTLNRFVGEQSSVQKNLNKLYGELKDVESKCESLVRSGNMADAAIFSTRREEILFEISQKEGYLRELEPMVKEAQTVYEAYDKKLRELKKQSRMTVEEMKLRGNMKDLLGDLDELRRLIVASPDVLVDCTAETAGLDQKQNYGMSKGRPVGSGVTDHKTGHADGGDGGKQGVYKWSPASVRGGYRQHQDAGAEQDHEGKA